MRRVNSSRPVRCIGTLCIEAFRPLRLAIFLVILVGSLGFGSERPTAGERNSLTAPLDEVVLLFMDRIEASAAVLAVSHRGQVVVSRGYGWSDRRKRTPTQPDITFRLASNSKPLTSAITKQLIRDGHLDANKDVFPFLAIEPFGNQFGDERLQDVTVQHLLDHKGGWDRKEAYDPMYQLKRIQREMHIGKSFDSRDLIAYMLAQPLQFDPGTKKAYSNFGYVVLGRVIEKQTGRKFIDVLGAQLCEPLGIVDVHISDHPPKQQNVREVFYPRRNGFDMRVRDSAGGLASSAPSLCKFLNTYWITGEPRPAKQRGSYWHFGSLPNTTTALMEQRHDGLDFAVMFNSRRNDHYLSDIDDLRDELNQVLNSISQEVKKSAEESMKSRRE